MARAIRAALLNDDGIELCKRIKTDHNLSHLPIILLTAKAKTINKYLGNDYVVKSSVGHIRDLPTSGSASKKSTDSTATKDIIQ